MSAQRFTRRNYNNNGSRWPNRKEKKPTPPPSPKKEPTPVMDLDGPEIDEAIVDPWQVDDEGICLVNFKVPERSDPLPEGIKMPSNLRRNVYWLVKRNPKGLSQIKFAEEYNKEFGHSINALRDCCCSLTRLIRLLDGDILQLVKEKKPSEVAIFPPGGADLQEQSGLEAPIAAVVASTAQSEPQGDQVGPNCQSTSAAKMSPSGNVGQAGLAALSYMDVPQTRNVAVGQKPVPMRRTQLGPSVIQQPNRPDAETIPPPSRSAEANPLPSRPAEIFLPPSQPQANLQSSRPQVNLQSSRPQANLQSSRPQANLQSSQPGVNLQPNRLETNLQPSRQLSLPPPLQPVVVPMAIRVDLGVMRACDQPIPPGSNIYPAPIGMDLRQVLRNCILATMDLFSRGPIDYRYYLGLYVRRFQHFLPHAACGSEDFCDFVCKWEGIAFVRIKDAQGMPKLECFQDASGTRCNVPYPTACATLEIALKAELGDKYVPPPEEELQSDGYYMSGYKATPPGSDSIPVLKKMGLAGITRVNQH